jgi:hypothetical protein
VGRFSSGGTHKSSVNECSYTVIETLPRSDPMIGNTTVTAYLQNQGDLTLFRGPDIDLTKSLTSVTTTENAAVVWEELE